MNKLKFCIPAVIILVVIMYKCIGCTYPGIKENQIETTNNNINTEGQILTDNIGSVMEGMEVPDVVLDAAKSEVKELFENNKMNYPNYDFINWRIENLSYSYTYPDLNGMQIAVYQMNYEFLSESPENIVLAGGMYITEDNWVMPGYPNSIYLIFRQDDDKVTFIQSMVENDCTPGDQLFTEDLQQILTDKTSIAK